MSKLLQELNKLKPETLELLETIITASASIIGAVIVALVGRWWTNRWLSARDRQDREVEWRKHAIELTKLDLQRKIKTRDPNDTSSIRPSILDFLANYRDLQELGSKLPKDLYLEIIDSRIKKPPKSPEPPESTNNATQE